MKTRILAVLYVIFAFPLTAYLAWRVPPFQVADEDNHFLRAVQIAQLGVVAERMPSGLIGGRLPAGAGEFAHGFADLHFHGAVTLSPQRLKSSREVGWKETEEITFANTAIYPPFFYLPAAAAIRLARGLNLGVLSGLRCARLATAFSAVVVSGLAIAIAVSGGLFLFFLLSLPMTLSLFASCSQDALVIAFAALGAAWISRLQTRSTAPRTEWWIVSLMIGCLCAAKPPYLALGVLPALWAARTHKLSGGELCLILALPFIVGVAWLLIGAAPVLAPNNSGAQTSFLVGHPLAIFYIAIETLKQSIIELFQEFIGVLGWLDVRLPKKFYWLAFVSLVMVIIIERLGSSLGREDKIMWTVLSILSCCGLIFFVLYLDWTPTGAMLVQGVQGRYFIPVAAFGLLTMPQKRNYPLAILCLAAIWIITSVSVLLAAISSHYLASAAL